MTPKGGGLTVKSAGSRAVWGARTAMTSSPRVWTEVAVAAGISLAPLLVAVPARSETPGNIIAAQIRRQGYPCRRPLVATRNRQASKPNETVWVLTCTNATYRVRLVPDLAAQVIRLR